MTLPVTVGSAPYDPASFPYLAPTTTEYRLRHCTDTVYNVTSDSHIYKIVDALCGDGGAGSLKKELLFSQFSQDLNTIFFRDLDNIFGKIASFVRYASESYTYDPATQQLTTEEWDEVMVKDNWYRQRIKDFMLGIGMGGTPQGFRMMSRAALGIDSDLYEVSYYVDANYPNSGSLGRTGGSVRNEVVIKPLKSSLTPSEQYLLNGIIEMIKPQETVITIDINGLAINDLVTVNNVAASSSYFQVESQVTGLPDLANLPSPQILAQNLQLDPSYLWVQPNTTVTAPHAAFQATQETSQFYFYSYGGDTTTVDTVTYCEDNADDLRTQINPYTYYTTDATTTYGPWTAWDVADSPDNFPGGKNGQTPFTLPALTKTGSVYYFPYSSQSDFINKQSIIVTKVGGQITATQYRLPIAQTSDTYQRTWAPELSIPLNPPIQTSSLSTQWVRRSPNVLTSAPSAAPATPPNTLVTGGV